jgi:hypothetical protein
VKIVHYEGPDKNKGGKRIRDEGGISKGNRPVGECKSGRPLKKADSQWGSNMNSETVEKAKRSQGKGKSFG